MESMLQCIATLDNKNGKGWSLCAVLRYVSF